MKRIVICADGTWNRPEQPNRDDYPTHVLRFARGVAPHCRDGNEQVVFYDWGIGSYHDRLTGGGLGTGLEKNVMDGYRFLIHNYRKGDEIYLFGFSRGAYTVRSLCGLINNCGILKSAEGKRVEEAFALYKKKRFKPSGAEAKAWRRTHAVEAKTHIHFVGVWDTVGAMGLPFSVFGLIKDRHLFFDRKLGGNVRTARQALALDEVRQDFEPTIWEPRDSVDLKQVWFAGVHSDVGGSYKPDGDDTLLADIPMLWMMDEARASGLAFDQYLKASAQPNPLASQHNEYKGKYRLLGKLQRTIPDPDIVSTRVHASVKQRYAGKSGYRSGPIDTYVKKHGAWPPLEP